MTNEQLLKLAEVIGTEFFNENTHFSREDPWTTELQSASDEWVSSKFGITKFNADTGFEFDDEKKQFLFNLKYSEYL